MTYWQPEPMILTEQDIVEMSGHKTSRKQREIMLKWGLPLRKRFDGSIMTSGPAGDLGIEIDLATDKPGAISQREERDDYHDYLIDGELVINPFDVETLQPGFFRLRAP